MDTESLKYKVLEKDFGSLLVHVVSYNIASNRYHSLVDSGEQHWAAEVKNRAWRWCWVESDFISQSKATIKKLEDREFRNATVVEGKRSIADFEDYLQFLRKGDFSTTPNAELYALFERLFESWTEMNLWGHVPNCADFYHSLLTEKMTGFISARIKEKGLSLEAGSVFSEIIVSTERSELQQQEFDFYALLALIQRTPSAAELFEKSQSEILKGLKAFPEIARALEKHAEKYDWIQTNYDGDTFVDAAHFAELLSSEIKQGVEGEAKLSELREKEEKARVRQKQLLSTLPLSEEEENWIEMACHLVALKAMRKEAVFKGGLWSLPLVKEMGKRLELSAIQVRHLTLEELKEALAGNGEKPDLQEINARIEHCVFVGVGDKVVVYSGAKAREFSKNIVEDAVQEGVSQLKGQPASPGYAKGVVRIVNFVEDMAKLQQGDILVSVATNPNLVPAMKKAGAIVTDAGGITSHAAIVSRELGIPCVVGTKIVTKLFKDGDMVEVDAVKGIVRKLGENGA